MNGVHEQYISRLILGYDDTEISYLSKSKYITV